MVCKHLWQWVQTDTLYTSLCLGCDRCYSEKNYITMRWNCIYLIQRDPWITPYPVWFPQNTVVCKTILHCGDEGGTDMDQGPISRSIFFSLQFKFNEEFVFMELHCRVSYISTKFCTCHICTVVMPCAIFYSNHFFTTWVTAKLNFHGIWITMEKLFMKWAPYF